MKVEPSWMNLTPYWRYHRSHSLLTKWRHSKNASMDQEAGKMPNLPYLRPISLLLLALHRIHTHIHSLSLPLLPSSPSPAPCVHDGVYMHTCVSACVHVEDWSWLGVLLFFPSHPLSYDFRQRSFTESWACQFGRVTGQQVPGIVSSLPPWFWDCKWTHHYTWLFTWLLEHKRRYAFVEGSFPAEPCFAGILRR